MAHGRLGRDARLLWRGHVGALATVRCLLFCATALWPLVLLLPGDTMAGATTYDTIEALAAWLRLPPVAGLLSPGELLLGGVAGALTAFSTVDYLRGGRRDGARVYLASIFWIGLAASYLLANPRAYGSWLFVGFALLSVWCLVRVRAGGNGAG